MLASNDLVPLVGVADLARARDFYSGVLGLPVISEDDFAVAVRAGAAMLRLTAVGTPVVAPYSVLAWRVDDIAAAIGGLVGRGVEFVRYDGMEQDELGAWTAPGGAKVAWFLDPDGNNLSLVQFGT